MPHPRLVALTLALLVAGVVLVLVDGGVSLTAIGWGLAGVAGVLFVAYAFLLVGESEDRHRVRHPRG